jgi:endoglucanase
MLVRSIQFICVASLAFVLAVQLSFSQSKPAAPALAINEAGYYEMPGVNVILFDDFYPDGHQGGLTIVQRGRRIAANGDLRLEPTPGQWSPVPVMGKRSVDREKGAISVELSYPDPSKDRKGFNPIEYPDLRFTYTVRTETLGNSIRLIVDLENPFPKEWADKVGFNLELFPGEYFGEHYFMDSTSGIFPRQADGALVKDPAGTLQVPPLAVGNTLVVAPGHPANTVTIKCMTGDLRLIDQRGLHNNGWFVVRSTISAGATKGAIEWIITPNATDNWMYRPVIQVSQVGYHPAQSKFAVIELDKTTKSFGSIRLVKLTGITETTVKTEDAPVPWGKFLRYTYLRFDFSNIIADGIYKIKYGDVESNEFEIKKDVYVRHVWQPTLGYFLSVQMCHMRVKDRYKVWHGLCHMDDAQMAPINHNHFDGYYQHESTLTKFAPGEHVPGLDIGGWHDAGDYDLRIESQAETVYKLALAYELFGEQFDNTSIDEPARTAELFKPDGKPDMIQQIEHGLLSIVGGYESMGRLYRGVICQTLSQYVHLGDASTITDNLIYTPNGTDPVLHRPLPNDDGWVFTEVNPERELYVAQALAAASRVLATADPAMAQKCLKISEELYQANASASVRDKINAAAELYLTTSKKEYEQTIRDNAGFIAANVDQCSEVLGRVTAKLNDAAFTARIETAVKATFATIVQAQKENPYGVPYRPYIWGAGWGVQAYGVKQLFLHIGFPKIFPSEYAFNALNFVLGVHPGENTSSFASGIGAHSVTTAYGTNRDDWSYIPGGIASGTALIRPDLPELKVWPYFWQQTEYVMGGGTADYLLLAMAADHLFNQQR